jgi:anti-sigma-K factor RskA
MNDAELFDLISAYALGALSEEERTEVEALLVRSPEARAELRSYADMMVGMAALAPRQQAPAHLNADFKARLAREAATPATSASITSTPKVTPLRLLLGLAAIILVVFGVYFGYRAIEANNLQRQIEAIQSNALAQRTALQPQGSAIGTVEVITAPGIDKAVVVAALPSLPPDQQYQLWMIVDSTPHSMGVFSTDDDAAHVLLDVPISPENIDFALGITVEPAGGSPLPTTQPIFLAVKEAGT